MRASVAVIGMGGPRALARCLAALKAQDSGPLELVVTHDPEVDYGDPARFPGVRFAVRRPGLELTASAILETSADRVLVTKDYCAPEPAWARLLLDALDGGCAAAGGPIDIHADAGATEWAFSFIDLHPYATPVAAGATATLSVHNVAYRRDQLEGLSLDWRTSFQEMAVHSALAERHGPLIMIPSARVVIHREVNLESALRERYALGRRFAAKRSQLARPLERLVYQVGAPAIPAIMLARIAKRSGTSDVLAARLRASAGPLAIMLIARAGGEWMGYLTGRPARGGTK